MPRWVAEVVAQGTEDGPELEAAVSALLQSPLVKAVERLADGSGVYATLWCVDLHKRRKSEQRQLTRDRTSLSSCARSLLELVNEKHGDHLAAAEAARSAAATSEAAAAGPSAPKTAFEKMAAAAKVAPAAERAAVAEEAAAAQRARQQALEERLAAVNAEVEAAEAEARRLEEEVRFQAQLEPLQSSLVRARARARAMRRPFAFTAAQADDLREAAGLSRKRQKAGAGDEEPT